MLYYRFHMEAVLLYYWLDSLHCFMAVCAHTDPSEMVRKKRTLYETEDLS